MKTYNWEGVNPDGYFLDKLEPIPSALPSFQKLFQVSATALSIPRSEERFSRNAETDLVCRLLLEKKKTAARRPPQGPDGRAGPFRGRMSRTHVRLLRRALAQSRPKHYGS